MIRPPVHVEPIPSDAVRADGNTRFFRRCQPWSRDPERTLTAGAETRPQKPRSKRWNAPKAVALAVATLVAAPLAARSEVIGVTISQRVPLGTAYERLTGRVDFALGPGDPQNRAIAGLRRASVDVSRRVRFSSDLEVVRAVDPAKRNGVLLFALPNRGRPLQLPGVVEDGFTIVTLGWQSDLPPGGIGLKAPEIQLAAGTEPEPLHVEIMVDEDVREAYLIEQPGRPPVNQPPARASDPRDQLTVRDRFWAKPIAIARDRWRFVKDPAGVPKIQLDGGFQPARYYQVTYRPGSQRVVGVSLAAIRDAASAFRDRTDLPVHGRAAYATGVSQTGRLLRQFLHQRFNLDQHGRPVFDAMLINVAGAAMGSFNQPSAVLAQGDAYVATRFPFSDALQTDLDGVRDGLLAAYPRDQKPRIFYVNGPAEYWGMGRAAALVHTSLDGRRDLQLPDNVRLYYQAGVQHIPGPFPPNHGGPLAGLSGGPPGVVGQQLNNPIPYGQQARALLRALHAWTANGTTPPPSVYPRLSDGTLTPVSRLAFPAIPGVADPRGAEGPARRIGGVVRALPLLVPQVDADGNDVAGLKDPTVAVPLATLTGWNFRDAAVGRPDQIYPLLGSWIPFPRTRAEAAARGDPRRSVEERYRDRDDYLSRVRAAAGHAVGAGFLAAEDVEGVMTRAAQYWEYTMRAH